MRRRRRAPVRRRNSVPGGPRSRRGRRHKASSLSGSAAGADGPRVSARWARGADQNLGGRGRHVALTPRAQPDGPSCSRVAVGRDAGRGATFESAREPDAEPVGIGDGEIAETAVRWDQRNGSWRLSPEAALRVR